MNMQLAHLVAEITLYAVMGILILLATQTGKWPEFIPVCLGVSLGAALLAVILMRPWPTLALVLYFMGTLIRYIADRGQHPDRNEQAAEHMPAWMRNTPNPIEALESMQRTVDQARPTVHGEALRARPEPGRHRPDRVKQRTGGHPTVTPVEDTAVITVEPVTEVIAVEA